MNLPPPDPYYRNENVKLFHGDTVEILSGMPPETFDLIFADPPYNLSNDGFTCHAGKRASVNKGKWDRSGGVREDFEFHDSWIKECRRVLKPDGSIWISGTYHSIYACGHVFQKQNWHIINDICWYKPNAAPNLSCRMFTASHETLIWAKKDKKAKHTFHYREIKNGRYPDDTLKKEGKQMRSVWAIGPPKSAEKRCGKHPTQKPEELLDRIILSSSSEGDMVMDPFCGSGTTGVSALKNNRKFVGIDSEKEYLENLSIPRIHDHLKYGHQRPRNSSPCSSHPISARIIVN